MNCGPPGSNGDVYQRLAPQCVACHGKGASRPYFASQQAFEDLLVYDESFVKPGKPEESKLVQLLRGTAQGNYAQMPLGGEAFAATADKGMTAIKMDEITGWISALAPRGTTAAGAPVSATIRRLSAAELVAALDAAVGLTPADLFQPSNSPVKAEALLIQSPNVLLSGAAFAYGGAPDRYERWKAIGGADFYVYRRSNGDVSPTFLQTVTQVGQARCRYAVDKTNNSTFFSQVGPDEGSATATDKIKQNIGQLGFQIFADRMPAAEIDALFTRLFVPYEKAGGSRLGWVAVCSALVRDPRFLFY
jgi:hypothetical protein